MKGLYMKCYYCNKKCTNGVFIRKFNGVIYITIRAHKTCYEKYNLYK